MVREIKEQENNIFFKKGWSTLSIIAEAFSKLRPEEYLLHLSMCRSLMSLAKAAFSGICRVSSQWFEEKMGLAKLFYVPTECIGSPS